MEDLKQKILKNYESDVNQYLNNELLRKGFLKTDNGIIVKLDVFKNTYDIVDFDDISAIIDNHVSDFWNIPSEIKDEIVYNNMIESLPFATESEIKNYLTYQETEKAMIDDKRLKSDVNSLLKANKKNHKKVFQGGYRSPEYQSQALINADVIYDDSDNEYYIFDKKNDIFTKLNKSDIWNILNNEFDKFNKHEIDLIEVYDNMKVQYFMFILNSAIPHIYNRNKQNKDIFIDLKDDYKKIKKIISRFN